MEMFLLLKEGLPGEKSTLLLLFCEEFARKTMYKDKKAKIGL
jgi:hypothetical protein